ncbi:HPP family protein [Ectopseudomonas mendocina]|uniref:HPP family protein n=1 Tax=Ectopseudomonas mendocina TaxID=300 RepID=A0ABZ2RDF3_ECTME
MTKQAFVAWLKAFWPAPMTVSRSERVLSCIGALLGLLFSGWLCGEALGSASPWLIAPMGASAVLLFAAPASPLAQPWSIIAGNIVSALVGVTCATWLGHSAAVAALAGGLAIGGMFALRCLHPPGGAVALTAVLAGSEISQLGYHFALYPVAVNSFALLLIALIFNNLLRRQYPHRPMAPANVHKTRDPLPSARVGFTSDDLDEVLKVRGELLDISRDDLEEILQQTEVQAFNRRFGEVRCADIMSRDVLSLAPQASLQVAREQLLIHRLNAMPVVGPQQEVLGLLTLHDLLGSAADSTEVSRCMRTDVPTCRAQWPVADLLRTLADSDDHHVVVVDEQNRLQGIISQSDLLAALYRIALHSSAEPLFH